MSIRNSAPLPPDLPPVCVEFNASKNSTPQLVAALDRMIDADTAIDAEIEKIAMVDRHTISVVVAVSATQEVWQSSSEEAKQFATFMATLVQKFYAYSPTLVQRPTEGEREQVRLARAAAPATAAPIQKVV